jgi:Ca-activated chloride channel homolog
MSFLWPSLLWFLLIVPLGIWLYLVLQRRRQRMITRFGRTALTGASAGNTPDSRRHFPPAVFMVALIILIVGMARPQMVVSLPRVEGTVILAYDVSGSMAATDVKPTRMDAAKAAGSDFVRRQPSTVQIGVVAFSDSGLAVEPPTNDKDAILSAISRLTPQRGTSLAGGILAALNTIAIAQSGQTTHFYSSLTPSPSPTPTAVPQGHYTSAAIVLLTDGENNENPDPLAAAQAAADRGVRIYTVGLGSPAGTTLHINGFIVHTQLDETMLQQISQLTGGIYYNAENETELHKIYNDLTPQLMIKTEETELTSLFAGAGVIILLIGGMFSLLWFSRLP